MQAISTAKFVRYTPRKINQVLCAVRGNTVARALEVLSFTPKSSAVLIEKVLRSAIANANAMRDFSAYSIKEAWVGPASTLKRMRPGPRGTGMPIKKRTAHLTIVISNDIPIDIKGKSKRLTNVVSKQQENLKK